MNPLAFNFDSLATVDDSSCVTTIVGCMDSTAFNYNPIANVNDSASCIPYIYGCMDTTCSCITLKSHGSGKFGRCLGELFIEIENEAVNLNQLLISEGHAEAYFGGKR